MENEVEQPKVEIGVESGSPSGADGKTYTQDELNRLFGERAKQAKAALLKELGFEDLDSATKLIKTARETEEAAKSELQKAQERAAELEKKIEADKLERREMAVSHEIAIQSGKLGIVDGDVAYKLLDKEAIEFDDNGKPKNIEDLLKKLVQDKPYLLGGNKPGAFNYGRSESLSGVEEEFLKRNPGLKI